MLTVALLVFANVWWKHEPLVSDARAGPPRAVDGYWFDSSRIDSSVVNVAAPFRMPRAASLGGRAVCSRILQSAEFATEVVAATTAPAFELFTVKYQSSAGSGLGPAKFGDQAHLVSVMSSILQQRPCKPNEVVVDAGAKTGFFSLLAAHRGCRVVAFETLMRSTLNASICLNRNFTSPITLIGAVATDVDQGVMHVPPISWATNANSDTADPMNCRGMSPDVRCTRVQTRRIDSMVLDSMFVPLMKLDNDGLELLAVRGAQKLFTDDRVGSVIFEFNPAKLGRTEASLLLEFFLHHNYGLCVLPRTYHEESFVWPMTRCERLHDNRIDAFVKDALVAQEQGDAAVLTMFATKNVSYLGSSFAGGMWGYAPLGHPCAFDHDTHDAKAEQRHSCAPGLHCEGYKFQVNWGKCKSRPGSQSATTYSPTLTTPPPIPQPSTARPKRSRKPKLKPKPQHTEKTCPTKAQIMNTQPGRRHRVFDCPVCDRSCCYLPRGQCGHEIPCCILPWQKVTDEDALLSLKVSDPNAKTKRTDDASFAFKIVDHDLISSDANATFMYAELIRWLDQREGIVSTWKSLDEVRSTAASRLSKYLAYDSLDINTHSTPAILQMTRMVRQSLPIFDTDAWNIKQETALQALHFAESSGHAFNPVGLENILDLAREQLGLSTEELAANSHSLGDQSKAILRAGRERGLLIENPQVSIGTGHSLASWIRAPRRRAEIDLARQSLAYVLPIGWRDINQVASMLQAWSKVRGCAKGSTVDSLHFVWAITDTNFSSTFGRRVVTHLSALWKQATASTSCFGERVHFMSLAAPNRSLNSLGRSAHALYQVHNALDPYFEAFVFGQTDTRPIRTNWLQQLVEQADVPRSCTDWWKLGSSALCEEVTLGDSTTRSTHTSGNAIYAVGCPEFSRFLNRVQRFYPPTEHSGGSCAVGGCQTGRANEDGFAVAQYQYLFEPCNYHYGASVMTMFVVKPLIASLCSSNYDDDTVKQVSPTTVAVSSKLVTFSDSEKIIDRVYERILNRGATVLESLGTYSSIKSGEVTESQLEHRLCVGRSYDYVEFDECQQILKENANLESWGARFPDKTYMWSIDLHSSPTACNAPMYKDAGGVLHAEIDSPSCIYSATCKTERLGVFNNHNQRGFSLESHGMTPSRLRRKFFDMYKYSEEFQRIDLFVCSYPAANCEIFFPFNKPLLIFVTTRLEFGRNDSVRRQQDAGVKNKTSPSRWGKWVADLRHLALDPRHTVVANNHYDAAYVKYMTGIQNVALIPSWCGDADDSPYLLKNNHRGTSVRPLWTPLRGQVLIAHKILQRNRTLAQGSAFEKHPLVVEMRRAQNKVQANPLHDTATVPLPLILESISTVYESGYTMADLVLHPAVVIIPYQVSTPNMFELYRLNVPLFAPSLDLLIKWHTEHQILRERIYGQPQPFRTSTTPSPNSDSPASLRHWLSLCDWYKWPHVVLFESWSDLMSKLAKTNLASVSEAMSRHNDAQRKELVSTWEKVLLKARGKHKTAIPKDFDSSLRQQGFSAPSD